MKIIFLDIDGVLNKYGTPALKMIDDECIRNMSFLLNESKAFVVLSTSWRYLIHNKAMDIRGFTHMLNTHGLFGINIIDITCTDEVISGRGNQITKWLNDHNDWDIEKYVVIDDDDYDITNNHPFVKTDYRVGLTMSDAHRALEMLR